MRALFIWTVLRHGPIESLQPASAVPNGRIRNINVLQGMSREVVEVSSSAACEGALIRFLQPHAVDMFRLLHIGEAANGDSPVGSAGPTQVVLDVTLLGVSRCVDMTCGEVDRPCRRLSQLTDSSLTCLVCPRGPDCEARRDDLFSDLEPFNRVRDLGSQAPMLIRRLLGLSWAALPEGGPYGTCAGNACAAGRRRSDVKEWMPDLYHGIRT